MNAPVDLQHLLPAWEQFRAATDISPIRDEGQLCHLCQVTSRKNQTISLAFELWQDRIVCSEVLLTLSLLTAISFGDQQISVNQLELALEHFREQTPTG